MNHAYRQTPLRIPAEQMLPAADRHRRWRIIRMQIRNQQEPCFGTDARYFCGDLDCPLRRECVALRARHYL